MDNEINTEETITTDSSVGGETADSKDVVSIHGFLSKELGKDFKDDESAIKAVKDTFKYVGKVGKVLPLMEKLQTKFGGENQALEQLNKIIMDEQPKDNGNFVSKEDYEKDMFFSKNPEHEENREIINALRLANSDKSLKEIVELPAYKNIFDKASAYNKSEKSKSVLVSNPRLGQASDKISKARESVKAGNYAQAQSSAVSAVLEAFEK